MLIKTFKFENKKALKGYSEIYIKKYNYSYVNDKMMNIPHYTVYKVNTYIKSFSTLEEAITFVKDKYKLID